MKATKTFYELGRSDGYCLIEKRYPELSDYVKGWNAGFAKAEKDYNDSQPMFPYDVQLGPNDTNKDIC